MYKLALAFVSLSCLVASPASAAGNSDKWIVTQLSGDARVVHPGAQPASLKVNNLLTPGDTLLTGPTGRATLVHGADYIVVAPRSELRLPTTPEQTGFTRVVQKLGTLLFKVKHTGIPHFTVNTPMLAAVVKGTTFTVVVDGDRSAVQVIEGKVEVTAINGGMNRMVEGGRTIFVNRNNPRMLLDADKPAPARSAPSSTSVTVSATESSPVAAISELTAGLVRVEASTPLTAAAATASLQAQPERAAAPVATTDPTARAPAVTATATPTAAPAGPATTAVTAPVAPVSTITSTPVVVASVSTPLVSIGSNSGPSGNSGPGSLNSGPGSLNSGSGNNSGPGSNSGPSTPTVTVASIATPPVTVAPITTPTVTVAPITTPTVTVPTVNVASISTPTVTVPSVTTPTVTVPALTTPTVTVPALTTPVVKVPAVTVPAVTAPAVTVPVITLPSLKLNL